MMIDSIQYCYPCKLLLFPPLIILYCSFVFTPVLYDCGNAAYFPALLDVSYWGGTVHDHNIWQFFQLSFPELLALQTPLKAISYNVGLLCWNIWGIVASSPPHYSLPQEDQELLVFRTWCDSSLPYLLFFCKWRPLHLKYNLHKEGNIRCSGPH